MIWGVEAADVVVAQRVVDEFELLAGCGDDADPGAAAGGDLVAERSEPGVLGQPLNRFDGGPANQSRALLGDPAALMMGGPWCRTPGAWGSSRPSR